MCEMILVRGSDCRLRFQYPNCHINPSWCRGCCFEFDCCFVETWVSHSTKEHYRFDYPDSSSLLSAIVSIVSILRSGIGLNPPGATGRSSPVSVVANARDAIGRNSVIDIGSGDGRLYFL